MEKAIGPVVHASHLFRTAVRKNTPKEGQASPLASEAARDKARELMAAATAWHRDWQAARIESGRGFRIPEGDLDPAVTPQGRLIRACKAYGHSQREGADHAERAAALAELLNAALTLPYSRKHRGQAEAATHCRGPPLTATPDNQPPCVVSICPGARQIPAAGRQETWRK